jgi:hypothetical protein
MMAEKRVLRYNNWSLFLLTYYSLFTVVISVFDDYFMPIYTYFDGLAVSAAVAVLAASLIVGGFRFERTASLYRDCYLSLQRLYDDPGDGNSKQKPYADILMVCPNHSDGDYYDFLVTHLVLDGKKVSSAGEPVNCTKYMIASFFWRRCVFWTFIILLVLAPLAFFIGPLAVKLA